MDTKSTCKFLAVSGALFLGSYNFTFSQNVMPHLVSLKPADVTPIFTKIYYKGASTILPIAAVTIAANAHLAYKGTGTRRQVHGIAAVLVFSTLPLTQLVMAPTINRLIAISKDSSVQSLPDVDKEVVALLGRWTAQNYLRGSLHLAAGAMSLWAVLVW